MQKTQNKDKTRIWSILLKIIFLSINIRAGILYIFPSLSGADAFAHARAIQYIIDYGFIPPYSVVQKYTAYPVFHVMSALTQMLTGLPVKSALFCSIGLYSIISTVFIYLLSKKVFGEKVGLLAVLLVNINTSLIAEGSQNIVPATPVTACLMLILYLIIANKPNVKNIAMLIFITVIIVFTHQLSTFVVFVSLTVLLLANEFARRLNRFLSGNDGLKSSYLILFAVLLISSWAGILSYQPMEYNFFHSMVINFTRMFSQAELGYAAGIDRGIQYDIWTNTLFDLGVSILLVFIICGMLRCLTVKDKTKFSISIVVLALFAIIYGTSSFGLRTLIPGRWFPIVMAFGVILAANYILELARLVKPKFLASIGIFACIAIVTFFSITTPNINNDSPLYALDRAIRNQFKASEVSSINTINEIYSGVIKTDYSYRSGIIRQLELNSEIRSFNMDYLNDDINDDTDELIVVREAIFTENVSIFQLSDSFVERLIRTIVDPVFKERFQSPNHNIIYTNNEVTGYLAN